MSEEKMNYKELIIKGILGSQILSVPFSCTLSIITLILATRFISKTSHSKNHHSTSSSSFSNSHSGRLLLSKIGAFFVAFVCLSMTAMELAIVYQSAVIHSGDLNYLIRAPWTSSLVPLLTALVSIATQTYFSDKTCHLVQSPRLFVPLLIILGIGSLVTGIAASVSLFTIGVERAVEISSSEGVFWSYLVITTLSSFVIMIPLLSSYFRDTKIARIESSRKANTLKEPSRFSNFMRLFFSTYTMVFLFDLISLITSILSASPNFQISLNSSEGFLVLQKMMVRIMSISYLWDLLDRIPKNPSFETLHHSSTTTSSNHKTKKRSSRNSRIQSVNSSAFSKYSISKTGKLSMDEEEENDEIFTYAYPPNSNSPIAVDVRIDSNENTPITSQFNNQIDHHHHQQQQHDDLIKSNQEEHVMIDIDLGHETFFKNQPTTHHHHHQIDSFNQTQKFTKPLSFFPRQKPPPSSILTQSSLPDLPHPSNSSSSSSFTNSKKFNQIQPTQKFKKNLPTRISSSLKYIKSNENENSIDSDSLLFKNNSVCLDHEQPQPQQQEESAAEEAEAEEEGAEEGEGEGEGEVEKKKRWVVKKNGKVVKKKKDQMGYVMTLNEDLEDGEISSLARNGKLIN
ncbi:hypothetical protein DFH28DRAFT_1136456 [Melampsora americana]|nr:hypothetical protein DFH28DRAFT_1136456 [Melampsora americana]